VVGLLVVGLLVVGLLVVGLLVVGLLVVGLLVVGELWASGDVGGEMAPMDAVASLSKERRKEAMHWLPNWPIMR
jgi:hypothetical protein